MNVNYLTALTSYLVNLSWPFGNIHSANDDTFEIRIFKNKSSECSFWKTSLFTKWTFPNCHGKFTSYNMTAIINDKWYKCFISYWIFWNTNPRFLVISIWREKLSRFHIDWGAILFWKRMGYLERTYQNWLKWDEKIKNSPFAGRGWGLFDYISHSQQLIHLRVNCVKYLNLLH